VILEGAQKTRVLVIDDSALMRQVMTAILSRAPSMEVVGSAADPFIAWEKIQRLSPDVVTLDVEMPRMDGLTFLEKLMRVRPLPVVMVSSLTERGCEITMRALELGAVDFVTKPKVDVLRGTEELASQIIAKVAAARIARVRRAPVAGAAARPAPVAGPTAAAATIRGTHRILAIGASTGGTEALREVLTRLPGDLPPIAIVQHIPAVFSKAFADRLNTQCEFEVREAVDGERLTPGLALIAPGNFHLMVQWHVDHYRARVTGGPQVWHQRPAVDLLFKSAADCGAAPHAIAGVLTGMGKDGAEGLLKLRELGATTFAQDEASCVVYGMPKVAWENGGAQRQLAIDRVADFIVHPKSDVPALASVHP